MKKLISLLFVVLLVVSCSGGGGGGGNDNGTRPVIADLVMYERNPITNEYEESYVYEIGDMVNFEVYASDPDLDMDTLYASQYLLPNTTEPYYPESTQLLPTQSDADMIYYLLEDVEIEGPAGNWRFCVYIVDERGNESDEFCVNIVTNP